MLETDGNLPTGTTLKEAVMEIDGATGNYPLYYMANCVYPTHFQLAFPSLDEPWIQRVQGLKANASKKSHAELSNSTSLDSGDPVSGSH